MNPAPYVGRFAPSPTGALHAGSIVTALASWLDARAHRGRWLLRIEDIDPPREVSGAADQIIATLQALGLHWDGEVSFQSHNTPRYEAALTQLKATRDVYACACSRSQIAQHWRAQGRPPPLQGQEWPYPGTCRAGLAAAQPIRSWRLRVPEGLETFKDRRCGHQEENVQQAIGDFVLRRADGLWAYQLAVVVDDAADGVTDVVRGEDLLDSTPRQRVLQRALNLPLPRTLHVGLVLGADGHKLSKQNGAVAIDPSQPIRILDEALSALGLPLPCEHSLEAWLTQATASWAAACGLTRCA